MVNVSAFQFPKNTDIFTAKLPDQSKRIYFSYQGYQLKKKGHL